jgi:hypothetical protein
MTFNSSTSFVDFGGYDDANMANAADLIWVELDDSSTFFWDHTATGVKFGDDEEYAIEETFAIFDTGTSMTYLPDSFGYKILAKILRRVQYYYYYGWTIIPCDL